MPIVVLVVFLFYLCQKWKSYRDVRHLCARCAFELIIRYYILVLLIAT